MAEPILYPRFARRRLEEALEDTPVVLVHGPRQCGKTTLARMVGDAAQAMNTSTLTTMYNWLRHRLIRWGLWPTCQTKPSWMRCNVYRPCSSR
jgi:hypothetical protein